MGCRDHSQHAAGHRPTHGVSCIRPPLRSMVSTFHVVSTESGEAHPPASRPPSVRIPIICSRPARMSPPGSAPVDSRI